jgi:hypothetical protein
MALVIHHEQSASFHFDRVLKLMEKDLPYLIDAGRNLDFILKLGYFLDLVNEFQDCLVSLFRHGD